MMRYWNANLIKTHIVCTELNRLLGRPSLYHAAFWHVSVLNRLPQNAHHPLEWKHLMQENWSELSGRQGGQGDAPRYQKMLVGNASQAYLMHGPSLPEVCLVFTNL